MIENRKRAAIIRDNASRFLEEKKVVKILEAYGQISFTGSYALDVMTWNDIDMQLVPKEGTSVKEVFLEVLDRFIEDDECLHVKIIKFQRQYKPKMPRGNYMGFIFKCPQFGGDWKLDLWILENEDFEKNSLFMNQLRALLDEERKELLLDLKHSLMVEGRVPQRYSYMLYQGLLQGHRDKQSMINFLKKEGFHVDASIASC